MSNNGLKSVISTWELVNFWVCTSSLPHKKELWRSLFQIFGLSRNLQYVLEDNVLHMLCGHLFERKAKKLWACVANSNLWFVRKE